MAPNERIVCECGGDLTRPVPARCPHCGAPITAVRHRAWPAIVNGILAAAVFAALVLAGWWLATQF